MCDTPTSTDQLLDGFAALGNRTHWESWIALLEDRIEADGEPEKPLADAVSYVAWLLFASEYIFYSLRWHEYVLGDQKDGDVFDWQYARLLRAASARMPSDVTESATLAVRIRHVLVHKGFPNPQEAPTTNPARSLEFSEDDVWDVRNTISRPANYPAIKARFDSVRAWLSSNTPGVKFGL